MTGVEIVVFQDKSWVRLTEYQKLQEETESLVKRIYDLQSDLSKEKSKNEELIKKFEIVKITIKMFENTEDTFEKVFLLKKLKELLGVTND